ncbi:MAG: RNA polymerase sigma factor [Thermoanaerobaculia bacterium]|nr:RNA polymerase sigma factor [Thermoanaerobaculia bacterium]
MDVAILQTSVAAWGRREMTASSDPDLETLRRVVEGDTLAFETLVRRHQGRILRLSERMLGNKEAAQEATQDVFFKAWRKASSFRPRAKVSTWLYRIAVNHCLNLLRRRKLVQFFSFGDMARNQGEEAQELDPQDASPDAERRLSDLRRWRRLREAIEELPAAQRAVLVLVRFEGLSYLDTATALGISRNAVESRLFRAMRRLEKTPGVF